VAAKLPAVEVTFDRVGWFDTRVAYLAPEPAEWFRAATARMYDAFPDYPPYEGAFDDVVPHLTVGDRGDAATMRAAVTDVERLLPITAHLETLLVVCGAEAQNTWRTVRELPLGHTK
jgi:2'-5' RNA ligase